MGSGIRQDRRDERVLLAYRLRRQSSPDRTRRPVTPGPRRTPPGSASRGQRPRQPASAGRRPAPGRAAQSRRRVPSGEPTVSGRDDALLVVRHGDRGSVGLLGLHGAEEQDPLARLRRTRAHAAEPDEDQRDSEQRQRRGELAGGRGVVEQHGAFLRKDSARHSREVADSAPLLGDEPSLAGGTRRNHSVERLAAEERDLARAHNAKLR